MSDSQESKGVSTPFDEEEGKSIPCTPNERKAKAKAQAKATDAVELKPMPEEKMTNPDEAEEKKSQEVRRHFCVMQAGLGGMLEVPGGVELATEKTTKTVISMPRKFDEPVKGMSHVSTGPVNSMVRNSQPPLEKAGDHFMYDIDVTVDDSV
ncbi:unnamed protein product [Phytophthora lilii]|uniref:Unnamed protein product n=1 Tax=Phytophthora lilii TaxID=2077276 RepID=A0A9W6U1Y9_9STRA|nr:unnamed protein product [Phytophthora lilii]